MKFEGLEFRDTQFCWSLCSWRGFSCAQPSSPWILKANPMECLPLGLEDQWLGGANSDCAIFIM